MSIAEIIFSAIVDFFVSFLPAKWVRKMPLVEFLGVIIFFCFVLGLIIWTNW